MPSTETTPSDPRDNCPECGERGRFDLGTVNTPACPNRACDIEHFRVPPVALTSYVVVRYPDSTYVVRTCRMENGRWVLASENPANMRDITQATLDGNVADAEVAG